VLALEGLPVDQLAPGALNYLDAAVLPTLDEPAAVHIQLGRCHARNARHLESRANVRRVEIDATGKIVIVCVEDAPEQQFDDPAGFEECLLKSLAERRKRKLRMPHP
jgi:hypothetical protein